MIKVFLFLHDRVLIKIVQTIFLSERNLVHGWTLIFFKLVGDTFSNFNLHQIF